MSGLLAMASLSFAGQHPAADTFGWEDSHGQFLLAADSGSDPFVIGKTSHAVQLARKQVAKDSGPDKAFRISIIDNFPIPGEKIRLAARFRQSGYNPEHILFRSGARGISPRAPPSQFSV